MFDQMKPICAIYVLYYRQGQSFGDRDLIKFLNLVNDPRFLFDLEQDPIF